MPDGQGDDKAKGGDEAPKEVPASGEEAAVGKAMDNLAEGGTDKAVDSNKAEAAVAQLQEARAKEDEESRKRAQELAKVTVSKEDVALVTHEFDMDAKKADTKLRENGGDLRKTLVSLLNEGLPSET